MNTTYLMQHIAAHLQTSIHKYTLNGYFLKKTCSIPGVLDHLAMHPELKHFVLRASSSEIPIIALDQHHFVYSVVTTPKYIFLVGPLLVENPLRFLHHLPDCSTVSEGASIPFCDMNTLIQNLLLLRNLFYEVPINESALLYQNFEEAQVEQHVKRHFSNILFQNQEAGKMHNPYDQEVREFSSIRNGDLQQLEQSLSESFNGDYGVLAKDKLRSLKNICIVVITLASRAAIEGGLSPEIAYSLSDSYIYTIEEVSDPETIIYLCREAEYEYTQKVHDIKIQKHSKPSKQSTNPRINQCKDYIFKHLHEKIYIKDIARELKTNANYLTELFSQSEGISIGDFIIQEKVNLARNLLIYSKYSYSEIAANLAFCSQSHFGKIFKQATNFTPKQYREAYGVKDFTE
ncbi:hypothetical protein YSY43_45850 [Paenibacillus sp. YSY-4.3]